MKNRSTRRKLLEEEHLAISEEEKTLELKMTVISSSSDGCIDEVQRKFTDLSLEIEKLAQALKADEEESDASVKMAADERQILESSHSEMKKEADGSNPFTHEVYVHTNLY